jgi:hypothetical protein
MYDYSEIMHKPEGGTVQAGQWTLPWQKLYTVEY